jgi:hypothetical protein
MAPQAAKHEQNHILRRGANPQRRVIIKHQVSEPEVAELQVAEHRVVGLGAAKPKKIPEKVHNWIQDLFAKIAPQLLPVATYRDFNPTSNGNL